MTTITGTDAACRHVWARRDDLADPTSQALAAGSDPPVGRAALRGAAIGFCLVAVAVTVSINHWSDAGLGAALGMGLFVGVWGGCGFGGMLGATLCLAHADELEHAKASPGRDEPTYGRPPVPTKTAQHRANQPVLWQPLDGGGAVTSVVGGKAAALDRLVENGALVPRAAALTVEAYRSFVDSAVLGPFLAALPTGADPSRLLELAEDVHGPFLEARLPPAVAEAIGQAYQHASAGGVVAVRSSAVAEDLASASFAGQYRSFLGVGQDGLERAVRLCWASLWAPGARAYRHAQGFETSDLAMGVVIQTMVEAERSGVVFTLDPTGSDPGLVRVEAVEGLGERLVSGEVTPEVFHVRRSDLTVLEDDGLPFLPELVRRTLEIEESMGGPQDIEWSLADGRLYVLQARPVTGGFASQSDGFDTPPVSGATFTPAGVGEMLPGALPPLLWTINAPMLNDAFITLFARLGIRPAGPSQPMVGRFRGRAALNLSLLKAAARRMPRGSEVEVERQYLGRVISEETRHPPLRVRERVTRVGPALRALRLRRRLVVDAEVFGEAAALALTLDPDLARTPTASLV
ncbi:MAG: hypothetical protein M3314_02290, partial [Actinomycetota bacterium]|nr:hypothetical protein [Actinomycetota bacterium]